MLIKPYIDLILQGEGNSMPPSHVRLGLLHMHSLYLPQFATLRHAARPRTSSLSLHAGEDLSWNQSKLATLSMDALDYINGCFFNPKSCM